MSHDNKPWVAEAIKVGRQVPPWIAALSTRKEFEAMMDLREEAFPKTRKGGEYNP